jgi:hypothetical protein
MRRTLKRRGGKKSHKGGLNIGPVLALAKGCPKGTVREFGERCGPIHSGTGCCNPSPQAMVDNQNSFFGKVKSWLGGKRRTRKRRRTRRRKTHRK